MQKKNRAIAFLATIIAVLGVLLGFFGNSIANSITSIATPQATSTPTAEPTPIPSPTPIPTPTATPLPVPIDFTCGSLKVTVNVDLNDGMNREEAITVAEAIINHELTNPAYEVETTEMDENGIWKVNLNWEYANLASADQLNLSHYFNEVINPLNQTVTYTRCY
jgi:hypothetical protein